MSATVHLRMLAVLDELPAIGKNQRNQQQGFNFRGIDDVLDQLNPLLAKHGVFFVPEVLERETSERTTGNNRTMWVVNLHVRYTFYGADGDSIVADGWGEGTDMGDKATQKAMTGAMKYVLFQTFAIATHEPADDADLTTPEVSAPAARPPRGPRNGPSAPPPPASADGPAPPETVRALVERVKSLKLERWVSDQHYPYPWEPDVCAAIEARCDLAEVAQS